MRLLTFFTCFLVAGVANAQSVFMYPQATLDQATLLREQALKNDSAYEVLESLTTEVGPRMGGSPADAKAVAWAQQKFKALGFDKVFLEPVTFPKWERHSEYAEVLSPFAQPLSITALGGSVGTGKKPLQAQVIEFANLAALNAADAATVKGKIVFVNQRMSRAKNGSGYGPVYMVRANSASAAAKLGAKAVVIRSIGTDSDRFPHTGTLQYAEDAPKIPAAALSNPDADLLSNMLKRGKPVTLSLMLDVGMLGEYTSHNVIGEVTGAVTPEKVVVIGGHLDSWDLGTGAIDDGAGVAITMAVGQAIAALKERPRSTIRVVAFANEEQGLYGGEAYAKAHANEVANHLIGSESDFGAGKIYRFDAQVAPHALASIDQIMQILAPLGIARGGSTAGGGPDLGAMRKLGMPTVGLAQDGTDYFDYHHTANDTLDKVDPESLKQNVAAWVVFAYLAAQSEVGFGSPLPVAAPAVK